MEHEASAPNQSLVLVTDRALVVASERSLAVTASLQEDAEREAFKAFLRRHPKFLIEGLSRHYPLDADLLERYASQWDWRFLSENQSIPWSLELIEKWSLEDLFGGRWDWGRLSENPSLPWGLELIKKFKSYWDWNSLSCNP